MVDLLDEVKEEMQREWWLNFWRRVGGYFVAGSIAVIVITVVTVSYQKIQKDKRLEFSASFLAAQEMATKDSQTEAAAAFEALVPDAPKGLKALAHLQEARALSKSGHKDKAEAAIRALVEDKSLDSAVRDMATLDLAAILVSTNKDYSEIEKLLHPLSENRQSKFASLARESLALAALDAGKREEAERMLLEVSIDASAPETQRQRVKNMLSALNPGAAAPAAKTEETAPAPTAEEPAPQTPTAAE